MRKVIFLILVFCLLLFVTQVEAAQNMSIKGGKVYLNLNRADVRSVLQLFAKATKTNIIASSDVTGEVTVTFVGIEPKEGLIALLQAQGLDWFEEHGTMYVSTKKALRTFYLEHARPSDIQGIISAILPAGSNVSVDDSYNVLVIQTTSDYLPRLENLIGELDIPPTQVMIDVRMIEIQHTNGESLGVDAKYTRPNNPNDVVETLGFAGRSTDDSAQGLYAHVISGNIDAYLSSLKTAVTYNTIANPRITTISNKEASLLIGQKLGYKTTVVTESTTTQEIKFLEVGTSLVLTPHVTKSGFIRMDVRPKISDGSVTDDLPTENTTETRNEVMVKDGQTFVIGGLVKEKDTQTDYGIPFIMDIPFLGAFFRRTVTSVDRRSLVVFVTPHILTAEYLESMGEEIPKAEEASAKNKAHLIH
ncbi:MAG: hypothetical protein HQ596_03255 [Candidatus Saganbacteria bacterium]|nr:hypothetical protein [Candidatus Saganbacteria bacterium]